MHMTIVTNVKIFCLIMAECFKFSQLFLDKSSVLHDIETVSVILLQVVIDSQ